MLDVIVDVDRRAADRRQNERRRGRPPRVDGGASLRSVRIRLTDQEFRDLEQAAAESQTTITELVRDAVNSWVGDYRDGAVFSCARKSKPSVS